jgi:hypothetical protein
MDEYLSQKKWKFILEEIDCLAEEEDQTALGHPAQSLMVLLARRLAHC